MTRFLPFKILFCLLFAVNLTIYSQAISYKWELIKPKYATADAFVAGINIMDYGADPTGNVDQTALIQKLLDFLGSRTINKGVKDDGTPNGGTLFLPEGKYLIKGMLIIPKGVTIRGEWEKPVKGQPIKGTVLVANNPTAKGNNVDSYTGGLVAYEARSLITLQPSAAARDLNIWYPEQDPNNIVPYPPAILFGQSGYWGNDYPLASNITLVNAYDGVIFSRRNGGGAPNVYGIYGTPLKRGIEIDNIAEVGRVNNIDFSPDYWAGSGLPGSPSVDGPHKKFIAENGTAITLRRIDWSFVGSVKAEGYHIGQRLDFSYNVDTNGNPSSPNGQNYGMEFTNCKYGVYIVAVSGAGSMFYDYTFNHCDYGFYFVGKPGGAVQIQGSHFTTDSASIYVPETNDTKVLVNQSTINKGRIDIRGGKASIVNCDFNNDPNQIVLGINARAIVTGNRFKQEPSVKNVSLYDCIIDHDPIEMTSLPEFPYKNQYDFAQKPAGTAFYVATENGVSAGANDNSDALQVILNKAKTDGGGVVFLPPGHYNFRKPITIPTGVELKGSVDVPCLPMGPGSAMEIYAGKGEEENGTPFISMEPGSGIRGLVMNYPEQVIQLLTDPTLNGGDVYHYPYTIRGNKDVYIVNIGLRACYRGIDLYTNKCDNHFMDYLAGHVFKTGFKVGGGSTGGHIYNSQFNQIAYASGGETKFGQWPNSPDNNNPNTAAYNAEKSWAYDYSWNQLYFSTLENCDDQVMFNNFTFGANRGFILGAGANGICLGQGIDAGVNAFYFEGVGSKGFNFINSQIVTVDNNGALYVLPAYKIDNRYIQVDPKFSGDVTLFGVDLWGNPATIALQVPNGTLRLQAANFANSGSKTFASVSPGAKLDIIGTYINPVNTLIDSSSAPQFYIQSSLVNSNNVNTSVCGLWLNNLEQTAAVSDSAGGFISRNGWIATASTFNENAMLTLDNDNNSFWSTSTDRQKPGQWFIVDMQVNRSFNGILMGNANATYNPVSFTVSVSTDSVKWTTVATGRNVNQVNFDSQTARYIKVEQTSAGNNAWRISEFFVINTNPDGLKLISANNMHVWFADGYIRTSGLPGISTMKIYSISGQEVVPEFNIDTSASIDLPRGIYIVAVKNKGLQFRVKLLKP